MLQPSVLTTPRPDVGRALTTLAKRCARALGSDRRPRRHVSTNTTPRFCVHHGPRCQAGRACLCKGEEGSRTWGKCRADTRGWRAQCFSRTTLGIGCEAWVLRPVRLPPAPESCRPDRPPGLHTMRKTQQIHRQRESRRREKRGVVSGLTQCRDRLSEPSSRAHRLASIGYPPPCSSLTE